MKNFYSSTSNRINAVLMLLILCCGTFVANATDIAFSYSSPLIGSTLDVKGSEVNVCIGFTGEIKYDKVVAIAPDGTEVDAPSEFNITQFYTRKTDVSVELKSVLETWLNDGTINPGETFNLKFVGIDALDSTQDTMSDDVKNATYAYKTSGTTTTTFVSGPDNSKIFYSYYMNDNADGELVYTFSGNLLNDANNLPTATMLFGGYDPQGESYLENLPVTVDGNRVIVNLRGKSRRVDDMVSNGVNYGSVRVTLRNVYDEGYSPVQSGNQGSPYSWQNSFSYKEVALCNPVSEFTPANGSSLVGVDNIEIWFDNYSKFRFSGIKFAYTDGDENKELIVSDYTKAVDADEVTINVAVPAEVKGKPVTVSLADLECIDGADHSKALSANYDKFVVLSTTPEDGAVLASIAVDQEIAAITNMDDKVASMMIKVTDLNPEDPTEAVLRYSYMQKNSEGAGFIYTNPMEMKLYQGHKYKVEFFAYADEANDNLMGADSIKIKGTTPAFEFSPVSFVSITPDTDLYFPGTLTDASQRVFVVKFDGLVKLDSEKTSINLGYGMKQAFESIKIDDSEDTYSESGYSDTWKLTVSEDFMNSCGSSITFSVFAYDMDNMLVEGNMGEKESSYLMFTYNCTFNNPELEVSPADGSKVTELSTIEFLFESGIMDSYSGQSIEVYNESGDLVASSSEIEEVYVDPDDFWSLSYKCVVTLDNTINTPGNYTVKVPAGMFLLQVSEYDVLDSEEMELHYEVTGESAIDEINVDSSKDSEIYNLQGIKLNKADRPGLYIIGGKKVIIRNK